MKKESSKRVSVTHDPELEWLLTYTSFEKECQTLQKDSKAYLDAMRGLIESH
jgi:hypothetical protein